MALNNCTFLGRLTKDPEIGATQSDVHYCRFCIAVDRPYVKDGEERKADFIDCLAWRSTADFIGKYFHKGDMIGVTGAMQTGSYEGRDGVKRKTCECVVQQASFAGSKSGDQSAAEKPQKETPKTPEGFERLSDDDIPF